METSNITPVMLSHETANHLKTLFANFNFQEPKGLENDLWRMLSDAIAYDSAVENVEKSNMVTSCKTLLDCWQIMQTIRKEMAAQIS